MSITMAKSTSSTPQWLTMSRPDLLSIHPIQSGDGEYPSHNVSGIAGFYTIRSVLPQNRGGNGSMADLMYLSPTISSQAFYQSLLAHEFQHLISCNQHVLLRNGRCEESWLNEAMSHVCEDLIGRHTQGGNRNLISRYRDEPYHYSLTGPAVFSTGFAEQPISLPAASWKTLAQMCYLGWYKPPMSASPMSNMQPLNSFTPYLTAIYRACS